MLSRQRHMFGPATLGCFSPPVMVLTLLIELGLAAFIGLRYALSPSRRIIILILICLGGFQLAEFQVCGNPGVPTVMWARVGYVLITFLPALGLHLLARLTKVRTRVIPVCYSVAAAFAATMAIVPQILNRGVCTGNYVIFNLSTTLDAAWNYYYMAFVLAGLVLAVYWSAQHTAKTRQLVLWLAIGYLSFTVPAFGIYFMAPLISPGLPSIMCGFAVVLAIILGLKIAPHSGKL